MLLSRCSRAISFRATSSASSFNVVSTMICVRREASDPRPTAKLRQSTATAATTPTTRPRRASFAVLASASSDSPPPSSDESIVVLKVEGMVCSKCTDRVENALMTVEGVSDARADLATGDVRVVVVAGGGGSDAASLAALVEEAGFGASVSKGN